VSIVELDTQVLLTRGTHIFKKTLLYSLWCQVSV